MSHPYGNGECPTHTHAFSAPWVLKYDELRASKRWTAIGPIGRVGDFETMTEALDAIRVAIGCEVTLGEAVATGFGHWCPVLRGPNVR